MRKAAPSWRFFSVLAGLLLGALATVSRVKLHAHSMLEVVAGCVLGAGAILLGMLEQPWAFVVVGGAEIRPSWRPAGVRPRGHHIEAVSKVLHVAEIEAVGRRSLPDRQADVC